MGKREIVHVEIPAKDRKTAAEFYEKLFGWGMNHMDEMDYTVFDAGNTGGGLIPLTEQTKVDDVRVYVASENIEADLKEVVALGGEVVMPKTEIPENGHFAFFKDPTGNVLALYTGQKKS